MTSVIKIYDRAIDAIDDPFLTQTYKTNKIDFCEIMFGFLQRAIPLFNTPAVESMRLETLVEPQRQTSDFVGDGVTKDYQIQPLSEDNNELIVQATINGEKANGSYDFNSGIFTFNEAPSEGDNIEIIQYTVGNFKADLDNMELSILSLLLVSCWSEKEENFLLDIRRLLHTSDFKLHDASSSLKAKMSWHYSMYEKAQKLMNNYSYYIFKRKNFGAH